MRGRARRCIPWLTLAVGWSLGAPTVSLASYEIPTLENIDADPTPHLWGSYHDMTISDSGPAYKAVTGDFNGDGLEDIARIHGIGGETTIDVFASSMTHFDPSRWADQGIGSFWDAQVYLAGDLEGDDTDEVIRVFMDQGQVTIDVLKATGSTFDFVETSVRDGVYVPGSKFLIGDFTGDGRDDIAMLAPEAEGVASVYVYVRGDQGFSRQLWIYHGAFWANLKLVAAGDFDGDGDADLITSNPEPGFSSQASTVYVSDGASFPEKHATVIHSKCAYGFDLNCQPKYGRPDSTALRTGDFDGDGRTDLLFDTEGQVTMTLAHTMAWPHPNFIHEPYIESTIPSDHVVVGDWDGDGIAEPAALHFSDNALSATVFGAPSSYEANPEPLRWGTEQGHFDGSQHYFSGDFNGDDELDVARVFADNGHTSIDVHDNDGGGLTYRRGITREGAHWPAQRFLSGDFNGDQRSDILKVWSHQGQTVLDLYYGEEDGFTTNFSAGGGGAHWSAMKYVAGDFNNDGKTDVAKLWGNNGKLVADVYLAEESGFKPFQYWIPDDVPYDPTAHYVTGDFDGDLLDDIARLAPDSEVADVLYDGPVAFHDTVEELVHIDHYRIDVLRSTGTKFETKRWAGKLPLLPAEAHLAVGKFDSDDRDDIVLVAPTETSTIGLQLLLARTGAFDVVALHQDSGLGYAQSQLKAVAGDFDNDGRAELMTIYPRRESLATSFDVWGGETDLDPTRIGTPGDTETYTPEQVVANLAAKNLTLKGGSDLKAQECTIIYPNAAEEVQARDLGLLVCAEELNGKKGFYGVPLYGGCDFASGIECSIGVPSETITIFGETITIKGPSISGCASLSKEMVCAQVRSGIWSQSFSISSSNIYGSAGIYVGPLGGASATLNNSVISGKIDIKGVGTFKYSVDTKVALSAGNLGYTYLAKGATLANTGPVVAKVDAGLDKGHGTAKKFAGEAKEGITKTWTKVKNWSPF